MTEQEAIDRYNRSGAAKSERLPAVNWPDLSLERATLERLAEAVLESRVDLFRMAFGDGVDPDAGGEQLEEAWRTDDLQVRFAPEGVMLCAEFTVRLELHLDDEVHEDSSLDEQLSVRADLCLSFTERHGVRPFVDFMAGEVRRQSDGSVQRIDPFSMLINPADAVAWELNASG